MKKIIFLWLCVVLCVVGTVLPAFATDTEPEAIDDIVPIEEDETAAEPEIEPVVPINTTNRVINTTMSLNPQNSIDSALSSTIKQLFGEYTPRTQTITQYTEDGSMITYTEVVPGLAGLDWPWLATAALFSITIYSILRMIGGLLKWH